MACTRTLCEKTHTELNECCSRRAHSQNKDDMQPATTALAQNRTVLAFPYIEFTCKHCTILNAHIKEMRGGGRRRYWICCIYAVMFEFLYICGSRIHIEMFFPVENWFSWCHTIQQRETVLYKQHIYVDRYTFAEQTLVVDINVYYGMSLMGICVCVYNRRTRKANNINGLQQQQHKSLQYHENRFY